MQNDPRKGYYCIHCKTHVKCGELGCQNPVDVAIPLHREQGEQFHAVDYSGFWNIQKGSTYGDKNILDAEMVGAEDAEKFANLIAELLNKHYGKSKTT